MGERNEKLRALRKALPSRVAPGECMSRAELAEAVNDFLWETTRRRYELDGHIIARYERGAVRWPSAHYRAGLRAVLGANTDAELGFRPTPRGNSGGRAAPVTARPDHYGGSSLGVDPAEFLARTSVETPVPAQIGWTDVEHVRATTRAVAMSENMFGGGLSCEAATAQLRWAGKLLETRAGNDVRRAMFEAVGNLSGVVAFAAFDIANYQAADRYFEFALWCAGEGGSWALRANTLADMSRMAFNRGNFDEALSLIEFAQVRDDRISATARAMSSIARARALAFVGTAREVYAEIDNANRHFADRDPESDPPWLCCYDEAEHQAGIGRVLLPIARQTQRPELAAPSLEASIRLYGAGYPRSRTFSRARLATLLMTVGEPHEAVSIGRKAVSDAASLRSQRVVAELRDLANVAHKYTHISEVAELQNSIAVQATT